MTRCEKNWKESSEECGRPATIYDPRACWPITTPVGGGGGGGGGGSPANVPSKPSDGVKGGKRTVHLLEKLKEIRLKFAKSNEAQSCRFKLLFCAFLFSAAAFFVSFVALVYVLNADTTAEVKDIIVDGEFQVQNLKFSRELLDRSGPAFALLARNFTRQLDALFGGSELGEFYAYSRVLEFTPEMVVKCVILYRGVDKFAGAEDVIGGIGLTFLRGLRLMHNRTWLGNFAVNVQTIGFQVRGEEGIWGEWSEWEGCDEENAAIATRSRICLKKDTLQVTSVNHCLLIPGDKSDFDRIKCSELYPRNDTDEKIGINAEIPEEIPL